MNQLYFCIGCRQVHYDNDYSEKDGDLLIISWRDFLESIENIKKSFNENHAPAPQHSNDDLEDNPK